MKPTENTFSDEELVAFLDNEGNIHTSHAIAEALKTDPTLQQRLQALELPSQGLKAAFDALLSAAPAMPALPTRRPNAQTGRGWWNKAAATAACVAIGMVAGTGFSQWRSGPADWKDYVAAYQALYVPETLMSVTASANGAALTQISALSKILNHDLAPATTGSVLNYKRAQILGFQGRPLVQIAYLSPAGAPVALCVMRSDVAQADAVTSTNMEGMAAAHWQKEGLVYLLIGGTDQGLITKLAQDMRARL